MNAWMNANKDVVVLIMGGLGFAIVVYEILSGKTFSNRTDSSYTRSYSRKTEPGAFWTASVLQLIFPNGAILYLLYWLSTVAG